MPHGATAGDDAFPFLLFTLSIKKSEFPLTALTINLMNEILSKEHYINIAARLDHASDAENLVDFIYHFLFYYSLSNQDSIIVDMQRRTRRFMLAVISTMHGLSLSNIPYDPDGYTLPLLLSILNNKLKCSIMSIVNKMTINLMTGLLSREGHVTLVAQIDQASDAKNLLGFIPHMLHYDSNLSNHGSFAIDMNRQAKQFMLGLIEKMRGEPLSNVPYDDARSNILLLLLYVLNNKEPESAIVVNALAIDLMIEILSMDDYITLAERINQVSDAKNILDFTPHVLRYYYAVPSCGFANVDVSGRAKQFMLAIISKMNGEPPSMMCDPHANTLPLLLYMLNNKEASSTVANKLAADLMSEILSTDNYITLVTLRINQVSDAKNLLDFMLRYYSLPNHDSATIDLNRRARRCMLAVVSKTHGETSSNVPYNDPHSNMLPLVLYILNNKEPGPSIELAVDLMCEILSGEEHIDLALRLANLDSKTEMLLEFIPYMIYGYSSSRQDFFVSTDTVKRRAQRFMLELILKTQDARLPSLVPHDPDSYILPLLLHFVRNNSKKPRSQTPFTSREGLFKLLADLVRKILSRDDYVNLAARLDHASDSEVLLNFMLNVFAHLAFKSGPGPDAVEISRRVRRLVIEIFISNMWHGIPLSDDIYLTQSCTFPFLLFLLDHLQKLGPAFVINSVTVNLMSEILSRDDYIDLVTLINKDSRAKRILDLLLEMICNHSLSHQDSTVDISWRARRFMLKVISKTPVIPPSLILTGVTIPAERNSIGSGFFGNVFKAKLRGTVVALKVLHESDDQVAFCREAVMWRSLKHKFVLPFLGIHEMEDPELEVSQFFFVSPYMKNGTLSRWRLEEDPPQSQIEERILEVAQAMEYIHSEGAVHGDLHEDNILLDDDLHAQIADFGLTRLSEASGQSEDDEGPSRRTQMADVHAFGCLYQEIHFDSIVSFTGKSDLLTLDSRGVLPPRLEEQPLSDDDSQAWGVIRRCLVKDPLERPTMHNVVESMMAMTRYGSPGSCIYPGTPRTSPSPHQYPIPHLPGHLSETEYITFAMPAAEGGYDVFQYSQGRESGWY